MPETSESEDVEADFVPLPATRQCSFATRGGSNPWAARGWGFMHDDTANSDATMSSGPRQEDLVHETKNTEGIFAGMVPTTTYVTVGGKRFLLGLAFGNRRFRLRKLETRLKAWRADDGVLVAEFSDIPPRENLNLADALTLKGRASLFHDTSGGAYFVVLKRDATSVDVMIPAIGQQLLFITFDGTSFSNRTVVQLDGTPGETLPPHSPLHKDDELIGAMPVWRDEGATADVAAHWWVTGDGLVGVTDPSLPAKFRTFDLGAFGASHPETVANSLAVGKKGAYIISNQALYRFEYCDGEVRPIWRYPYAVEELPDTKRLNTFGSGTTPTLMGDDYVAIADGAERMSVVVVPQGQALSATHPAPAADAVPAPGPVAKYAVFGDAADTGTAESGCENSVIAAFRTGADGTSRWRIFIGNTWGYQTPFSEVYLRSAGTQGLECLELTESGGMPSLRRVWANTINVGTAPAKLSMTNQVVFFYAMDVEVVGALDRRRRTEWSLMGLDAEDQSVRFRLEIGKTGRFVAKRPGMGSRKYENAWGTMMLTDGGLAICWWKGLRLLRPR